MLVTGDIEEVLPLEDADLLKAAKPIRPDGTVRFDADLQTARHDAQGNAVIGRDAVGLIVLGGAHDLSESVRRMGGGKCEYIRVTTKRVREFMGEERK